MHICASMCRGCHLFNLLIQGPLLAQGSPYTLGWLQWSTCFILPLLGLKHACYAFFFFSHEFWKTLLTESSPQHSCVHFCCYKMESYLTNFPSYFSTHSQTNSMPFFYNPLSFISAALVCTVSHQPKFQNTWEICVQALLLTEGFLLANCCC